MTPERRLALLAAGLTLLGAALITAATHTRNH